MPLLAGREISPRSANLHHLPESWPVRDTVATLAERRRLVHHLELKHEIDAPANRHFPDRNASSGKWRLPSKGG
jgi:hypothetical protein